MFKNVASQSVALFAFDITTGSPKTGDSANMVFYAAKDFGSVTAISAASGVPTEIDSTNAKGWYKIALSQTETNADNLLFTGKSSTSNVSVTGRPIDTFPANFSSQSIDGSGRVDVIKIAGTTQTARDIGASVLLSTGTGTGQIDFTSGVVKANLAQILGTALTETAGQIAAAFKKFFNIASPAATMDHGILIDTVTTATNTTNAPSAGDFTAAMKTSLNAATPASVVGAVGSVSSLPVGVINAASLASDAVNAIADGLLDRADGIEVGLTLRNAHRLEVAATAGKLSGAATTTVIIRNAVADSKNRITATVDSNGNRSAITTDLT